MLSTCLSIPTQDLRCWVSRFVLGLTLGRVIPSGVLQKYVWRARPGHLSVVTSSPNKHKHFCNAHLRHTQSIWKGKAVRITRELGIMQVFGQDSLPFLDCIFPFNRETFPKCQAHAGFVCPTAYWVMKAQESLPPCKRVGRVSCTDDTQVA